MKQEQRHIETEMAIVGTGLAGVAASIFALNNGINPALAGNTGALAYTTGYLDLLGNNSNDDLQGISDPWQGLSDLRVSEPDHPLARLEDDEVRKSFEEFTSFISECGIVYGKPQDTNIEALTPVGTVKKTLCVPATMQAGVEAYSQKSKCLIIDFKGLRGFSGRQIVANLAPVWPGIRYERIHFDAIEQKEIYPEVMARALEVGEHREKFAAAVKNVIGDAEVIGMPAVFGVHSPDKVMHLLQELIGVPLFEIPTMPPSVPGIRLREMVEQVFPHKGISLIPQQKVKSIELKGDGAILSLSDNYGPIRIDAKTVILATGRFISGGLEASMDSVTEPLLDLPVIQPDSREQWYRQQYMDKAGHLIHQAGIEVDDAFRPVDLDGNVVNPRLFAAGILLAHQDWIRSRSGAGIAIATAYRAVDSAVRFLRKESSK